MRKILFIVLVSCLAVMQIPIARAQGVSPSLYNASTKQVFTYNSEKAQSLEICNIPVTHMFTHALVAHPKIAFDKSNLMSNDYDKDCLTPLEFKRILSSLYRNNYMLIDINDTFVEGKATASKKSFMFPATKKPLVISFDDINYYTKKMNLGMADKLIVDDDGNLATYTKYADKKVSYENDVVPILESFVKKHPDFSYKNAKATLCLTGFDGVLGYRTQSKSPNKVIETINAKKVISVLKEKGYNFACHSFGHYHMNKISAEKLKKDTEKWLREVKPLVGDTNIYVYPYGEWEIEKGGKISPKHQVLIDNNFKLFCGVGTEPFYSLMPQNTNLQKSLFMDRIPLDGYSLRANRTAYMKYFDTHDIYDSARIKSFYDK